MSAVDAHLDTGARSEWYVYAVVPSDSPALGELGQRSLDAVCVGDLAVVGSPVFFNRGSDLPPERLEAAVRIHEEVVEALLAAGSVVPLRFGTAVTSRADAEVLLRQQAAPLRESLARVRGRAEWSLHVFARPGSGGDTRPVEDAVPPGAGRNYLRQRKAVLDERKAARSAVSEQLTDLSEALASASDGCVVAAPAAAEIDAAPTRAIAQLICLVERDNEGRFLEVVESVVEGVGGGSLEATISGPWPPYHFVDELVQREDSP